jgi:hypothetical protein
MSIDNYHPIRMLFAFTSGGAARGGDIGDVMLSQMTYQVKMTYLALTHTH